MIIKKQNLSVIIVSFKSNHVIHRCIESIHKDIKIIVIENSNDSKLKNELEKKYKNLKCILSKENNGMGTGNNIGINYITTDFAFILNPDVILENNAIDEICEASKKIESFCILAPISKKSQFPNYKLDINEKNTYDPINPFKVKSIDGYAMLLNLNRIKKLNEFNLFDENIFLYLENDDLCLRLKKRNENIYVVPKAKINHLGGEAVDPKFKNEIELCRNWHWMWSKFYFNKKHYGFFSALLSVFGNLTSAILKLIFYSIIFDDYKKKIYFMRISGIFNSILGKKSFYRPKI